VIFVPGRLLFAVASIALALTLMVDRWYDHGEDSAGSARLPSETWGADMVGQRPNTGGSQDLPSQQTAIWSLHHPAVAAGRNAAIPSHPETRPALQLWRVWKKLLETSQHQQIPIISGFLATSIRQHPDARVYDQINSLLAGTGLATENKALLLDLLSDIATPEALDILLGLTATEKSSATYFLVLLAIARMGDNRWGGEFHEALSPALELAWVNPDIHEPALVTTLASTLAKVGAPQGVDLLLQTLTDNDHSTQKQETERARQAAAFLAIPQTRNPNAVPVLIEWFRNEGLGTPGFEVSGDALAAIGSPEAIQEIVAWARQSPDEGARNLGAWLSQIEDEHALQAMSAVPIESFQSLKVGAVVKKFAMTAKP